MAVIDVSNLRKTTATRRHPIVQDGLRDVFSGDLEFEVVGEAADGQEAVALAAVLDVDVVLMDLRMPRMSGVEAIKALRKASESARVLVLTTYDTDRDVLPAIEAGATGYLLKDAPREELLRAVRRPSGASRCSLPPLPDG